MEHTTWEKKITDKQDYNGKVIKLSQYVIEETFNIKGKELKINLKIGNTLSYTYGVGRHLELVISTGAPSIDASFSLGNNGGEAYKCIFPAVKNAILQMHWKPDLSREVRLNAWDNGEAVLSKYPKEAYTYAYPNAKRICTIIVSKGLKQLHKVNNITQEETKFWRWLGWRVSPGKGARHFHDRNHLVGELLRLRDILEVEHFEVILSDLKKYPQLYSKAIINSLSKVKSMDTYFEVLKSVPKHWKNCKYLLPLPEDNLFQENNIRPKTRFQWYMACALKGELEYLRTLYKGRYGDLNLKLNQYKKLIYSDRKLWAYFKKMYPQYKGNYYSTKNLKHMVDVIRDGHRMYKNMKDNEFNIHLARVDGSAMKMLRNASYNHHQEAKINVEKIKREPDAKRHGLPSGFPQWIQDIYLDTKHKMLIAGKECRHCLGSYASHRDYFVREGDVCAQIQSQDLTVGQCYDIKDTQTKRSEDLRKRLEKSLSEYKEKHYGCKQS